jgi:hypothetical protein
MQAHIDAYVKMSLNFRDLKNKRRRKVVEAYFIGKTCNLTIP